MTDIAEIIRRAYQAGRARGAVEAIEHGVKLPSVDADVAFHDDMYFWLDENDLGEIAVGGLQRTITENQAVKKFSDPLAIPELRGPLRTQSGEIYYPGDNRFAVRVRTIYGGLVEQIVYATSLVDALEKAKAVPLGEWFPTDHWDDTDTEPLPSLNALNEKYPEVAPFVERMLAELWANRGKGDQNGWRQMNLRQAWYEISWHLAKLAVAIRDEDSELVRELSADVGNGAMMLFDILEQRPMDPRL